jgi:hypothetical protein
VTLLFAKYAREVAKTLPSDQAYPLRGSEKRTAHASNGLALGLISSHLTLGVGNGVPKAATHGLVECLVAQRGLNTHQCRCGHNYPLTLFNEFFEVSPIGPFARTSNVRAPSSGGIGSSHGAAINVSCASERPCAHRVSIVGRSNS